MYACTRISGILLAREDIHHEKSPPRRHQRLPRLGNDLAGCVNDTANLRGLLIEGVRIRDRGNTCDSPTSGPRGMPSWMALPDLVATASGGDTLVFHYSGHGSQVPDENEDEGSDRMDEVICPRDFSWDGCWISDDDLSEVFARLPKDVHLEVLLDCCHSGTGTREIALGKRRAAAVGGTRGSAQREPDRHGCGSCRRRPACRARIGAAARGSREAARVGMMVKTKPRGLNHVLWAACRSGPVFGGCGHRREPERGVHVVLLRRGEDSRQRSARGPACSRRSARVSRPTDSTSRRSSSAVARRPVTLARRAKRCCRRRGRTVEDCGTSARGDGGGGSRTRVLKRRPRTSTGLSARWYLDGQFGRRRSAGRQSLRLVSPRAHRPSRG